MTKPKALATVAGLIFASLGVEYAIGWAVDRMASGGAGAVVGTLGLMVVVVGFASLLVLLAASAGRPR